MSTPGTKDALLAEIDKITFVDEACTVVGDAVREYDSNQGTPDYDDIGADEEAWSVLANQVVGHETF
jgi:hypothetical protein